MLASLKALAEEARYQIFKLHQGMHESRERERASTVSKLDPEVQAQELNNHLLAQSRYLRQRLRAVPYWAGGHCALGQACLDLNDLNSAFLSAQAALTLGQSAASVKRAKHLLARCYMRSGRMEQASAALLELSKSDPNNWEAREDLAACQIAAGRDAEARATLESVPQAQRSQSGNAALMYSQMKTEESDVSDA